ncbi:tRNA (guanosine(18)-2'-O)-methyltransferase TrmH [Aestuariirhabdus sp. Z084]|uniref:tRNA (guanosine(18)-2'-O)-methyltransferase TrmH n=1 Tax=Aestuariirhabdus haliotis TaxID=2918751 RepID=UPI00201B3D0E|nr:tRNA (guanosine(18)-2'-O)-methyltransferase TrmH [Aestuariirhabdus haliotis]MCL6416984.1 tRNA (guanosine(18)-2'-O)-methyltransferase TrmH [Aestuariirhabdus haliotis]MCL6421009.1 tRNA (guanosine(18)-2'-O)-methyltransferase TrmH [Aestuariirhabdus haliotis]
MIPACYEAYQCRTVDNDGRKPYNARPFPVAIFPMTPQRYQRYVHTLARRQPDLSVITDQVHKGRNLAAIIRTCDAVGIHRVHITEPREGYRPYRGTAMGSTRWVSVERHDTIADGMAALRGQGMKIHAAHLSSDALDYRDLDYTQPLALLLGAEKTGVSDEVAQACDGAVMIPMQGMVESYNVSVAAAIILNEAQHQRRLAGMYDQCRLPLKEYQSTLFRWCHPKLADWCDEQGLNYPALDDEGQLVEPSRWYAEARQAIAASEPLLPPSSG